MSETQIADISSSMRSVGLRSRCAGRRSCYAPARRVSPTEQSTRRSRPARLRLRHYASSFTPQWTLGADSGEGATISAGEARLTRRASGLLHALGFTDDEITPPTSSPAGDDLEGAPLSSSPSISRCSIAPARAGASARAVAGRERHPHDGGGPALHLRRDLEDDQHAERCHGRGVQATPTCSPGSWGSRRSRSIATARSSRSRSAPAIERRRRGREARRGARRLRPARAALRAS